MFAFQASVIVAAAAFFAQTASAYDYNREVALALRQLSARETYPSSETASCATGYDTQNEDGSCTCGAGRVETSDGTQCENASDGSDFDAPTTVTAPFYVNYRFTASYAVTGAGQSLDYSVCASVCSVDAECTGYYLTPATGEATAYCYMLGDSGTYYNPSDSGIPFIASTAKRAVGQTGFVGANGGEYALKTTVADAAASTGCQSEYGDEANGLSCTCGSGRVNTSPTVCAFSASSAARVRRHVVRNQSQW